MQQMLLRQGFFNCRNYLVSPSHQEMNDLVVKCTILYRRLKPSACLNAKPAIKIGIFEGLA